MDATPNPVKAHPAKNRFYSRYVWLVYSVFFFFEPVLTTPAHRLRQWIGIAIFYPIFLFLFLYPDEGRKYSRTCIALLYFIGLGYCVFNPSASGVVIYVAAFTPFLMTNDRWTVALLFAESGLFCLVGLLFHTTPWAWATVAPFAMVVGVANLGQAREERANKLLQRAHEEIEHLAKVAERERIARDLHDLLGHTLSMITLKAELAGKLIATQPDRAQQEIRDVEQTARRALTEVRAAVRGYRSEGLCAEFERAAHTLDTAGVKLERPASVPSDITPAEETVVALIVREATTNIVRHARATRAEVTVENDHGRLVLEVRDNGCGGIVQEGSGLRGMRERVEALNGRFLWESTPRTGTRLHCQFPMAANTSPEIWPAPALDGPVADRSLENSAATSFAKGGIA